MVKIDLEYLKADISTWSDEKLLNETELNINNYIDDVKLLLNAELEKRNISKDEVVKITSELKIENEKKEIKKYSGIKGWLLFFQIIVIIYVISHILFLLYSKSISYAVINGIMLSLFTTLMISIFTKKKSALKFIKGILIIFIVLNSLIFLVSLVSNSPNIGFSGIMSIINSILWFNYFRTSKRVITTFVK